uniref:Uncharacterized protein n=1 Tax=Musa acuminata subsp. malaccensis TaxID=214687 RepID=A0A804IFQ6_MUSAM
MSHAACDGNVNGILNTYVYLVISKVSLREGNVGRIGFTFVCLAFPGVAWI